MARELGAIGNTENAPMNFIELLMVLRQGSRVAIRSIRNLALENSHQDG